MNTIIKKPLITEKATSDSEKNNRFTFVVDRRANKIEIKNAVENMYGVTIRSVRTMNYGGGNPLLNILTKVSLSKVTHVLKRQLLLLQMERRLICLLTFN